MFTSMNHPRCPHKIFSSNFAILSGTMSNVLEIIYGKILHVELNPRPSSYTNDFRVRIFRIFINVSQKFDHNVYFLYSKKSFRAKPPPPHLHGSSSCKKLSKPWHASIIITLWSRQNQSPGCSLCLGVSMGLNTWAILSQSYRSAKYNTGIQCSFVSRSADVLPSTQHLPTLREIPLNFTELNMFS